MNNKKFILFFFIGSFIIFLTLPALNYSIDTYRVLQKDYGHAYSYKNPNFNYLKMSYILENPTKYDSYAFSSSRLFNIDTSMYRENMYNMAYYFGHIDQHLSNLKVLLNNNVTMKEILLGVDGFYLFKNPDDYKTDHEKKTYPATFFEKIEFFKFYLLKKPSMDAIKTLFESKNTLRDITTIEDSNNRTGIKILENNSFKNNANLTKLFNDNIQTVLGYNSSIRTTEAINSIRTFKELCDKNNIKLTVYFNPIYFASYLAYDEKEIENFKRKLAEITEFYDFFNLFEYSFNNQLWIDQIHFVGNLGDYMINSIKNKQHFVNKESIDKHIKNSHKNILRLLDKDFKVLKFNDSINLSYLNTISLDIQSILNTSEVLLSEYLKKTDKNIILSLDIDTIEASSYKPFHSLKSAENHISSFNVPLKRGNNKFKILIPKRYLNNELKLMIKPQQIKINKLDISY